MYLIIVPEIRMGLLHQFNDQGPEPLHHQVDYAHFCCIPQHFVIVSNGSDLHVADFFNNVPENENV